MEINENQILEYWEQWELPNKIPVKMTRQLSTTDIKVIKDATHRSIWMIHAPTSDGVFPIILKLCFGAEKNLREPILYNGLQDTPVEQFMPKMYLIKEGQENHGTLMFMECLKVASQKPDFTENDLYKVAPALAGLHASTNEQSPLAKQIQKLIPNDFTNKRASKLKDLKSDLVRAKDYPRLQKVINDIYPEIDQLVALDLDFPEVLNSGYSLTHGDLTLNNIGYDDTVSGEFCKIKFIDYGAALLAPCLLDLVKLIESPLDHHPEWDADHVRKHMVTLYLDEMKNHGITFDHDQVKLYKLAFLMRILDNEFRRNLSYALHHEGKTRFVFPRILRKIATFSRDLNLLKK